MLPIHAFVRTAMSISVDLYIRYFFPSELSHLAGNYARTKDSFGSPSCHLEYVTERASPVHSFEIPINRVRQDRSSRRAGLVSRYYFIKPSRGDLPYEAARFYRELGTIDYARDVWFGSIFKIEFIERL